MKKILLSLFSIFIFLFSFNFVFSCSVDDDCDDGQACKNSVCVASTAPAVPTTCASDQFKVSVGDAGVVCKTKISDGESCYYGSQEAYVSNTCKSGYCNTSTKKCASDPDCKGSTRYKLLGGLPFMNFSQGQCINVDTGIDSFLSNMLKFILGSVGTVTTIIIIIGGFLWAFSAGNKNQISKAQKMITDAVIGLGLTLTCGLMLQIVNPQLLDFGFLFTKLKPESTNIMRQSEPTSKDVKTQRQDMIVNCNDPLPPEAIAYIQNRDPYNDVPYNDLKSGQICKTKNSKGVEIQETIGLSGCGPTSAAKIFKYLGKGVTPKDTAEFAGKNGFVKCDAGTDSNFFAAIAKSYGFKYEFTKDKERIKTLLKEGKPLVVLVKGISGTCTEYFTAAGHYLVAACYDSVNNSVKIDDPYIWKIGVRSKANFDSFYNCIKTGAYYIYK